MEKTDSIARALISMNIHLLLFIRYHNSYSALTLTVLVEQQKGYPATLAGRYRPGSVQSLHPGV